MSEVNVNAEMHVDDLIEMYALGALESAELRGIQQHLATCPRCRALAAEAERTVEILPLGIASIQPSPQLGRALLARIDEDLEARARQAKRAGDAGVPRRTWREALSRGWRGFGTLAPVIALVSLLVLLALGSYVWSLQRQAVEQRDTLALLSQPDLRVVNLPGTALAAPGALARLFVTPDRHTALLALSGLKQLGPDQTYEFWLIREGQATSAGLFNVDQHGLGRLSVRANVSVTSYQQAGITIERAGGSQVPDLQALMFAGPIP